MRTSCPPGPYVFEDSLYTPSERERLNKPFLRFEVFSLSYAIALIFIPKSNIVSFYFHFLCKSLRECCY